MEPAVVCEAAAAFGRLEHFGCLLIPGANERSSVSIDMHKQHRQMQQDATTAGPAGVHSLAEVSLHDQLAPQENLPVLRDLDLRDVTVGVRRSL